MTWADYISQIRGLLGLAVGYSFIYAVKILYWVTIRKSRNFNSINKRGWKNRKDQESKINYSSLKKHNKVVALAKP